MTQQQAIEIIVREGLTHYHMDERETDEDIMALLRSQDSRKGEKEIVIRRQEDGWHIYSIDKEKGKKEHFLDHYKEEKNAWRNFVWELRWQRERINCRGTRQEVEKIMRQEGLRVNCHGVTWSPHDGREYELAIKKGSDGLWHLYRFGERAYLEWEETYKVEEEAWGEYLYLKRSDHQRNMRMKEEREEEERFFSLTREQAEEVICQKGLIQYNMDENQEEKEGDTVIRERPHWEVYEVARDGRKDEKKLVRFFCEEEAWGYLIKKLRYYNEEMKLRLRVQGGGESWIRRLIQHTEKGIKDDQEKREREILCGLTYTMEEEEVKQIIDREGLTGYSTEYCAIRCKPNVIVIGKLSMHNDFWQIVEEDKENENGHRMTRFSSEGEAWKWLLERLREKNGRGGQAEGETSCYLTRKEAEEIIRREGLTHYNIDPKAKENPGDLVLRKCRHWEIYEIKEEDILPKRIPYIRHNEREAWGLFIRELKVNGDNRNVQARKRQKEEDEKKKREMIKTHVLPRERAEQILVQENLTGYNKNEPREDQPEEMVIRRIGENWEVYCTDSRGEVHGEKELFTVEEEAWGWFIKGVRDNAKIREINRQLFGQDCLFAEIER